jgi:expansin (peptidoglycan-binding protein)
MARRPSATAVRLFWGAFFLNACALPFPSGIVPLGETQSGVATYYDADGSGACGFDRTPEDLMVAAMNRPQFAGSQVCGACAEVVGPKGTVTVRLVDLCPECTAGHLDLSREAFRQVAEESAGRVPVEWRLVACAVNGPVQYRYKEGSSQWWTAIQVRNHRLPVARLEIRGHGQEWKELPREAYNYFVDSSGSGADPVSVRLTSTTGQILEDTLPPPASGLLVNGLGQF